MGCCEPITGPGFSGHICIRRGRRPRCATLGCTRSSAFLCDFPVERKRRKSATCDVRCCGVHRKHVGPDRDYCLAHAELAAPQGELSL